MPIQHLLHTGQVVQALPVDFQGGFVARCGFRADQRVWAAGSFGHVGGVKLLPVDQLMKMHAPPFGQGHTQGVGVGVVQKLA